MMHTQPLSHPSFWSSPSFNVHCLFHFAKTIKLVHLLLPTDCLIGLVAKASASRVEDLGFNSHLWWDFLGSSHTSDLEIGTPVVTLSGAWRSRVSAGTGWPGVSILCLGEMES